MSHRCLLCFLFILTAACGPSSLSNAPQNTNSAPSSITQTPISQTAQPTSKLSLAVGGTAPGRDELLLVDTQGKPQIFASGTIVACTAHAELLTIEPLAGFTSIAAGGGAHLIATKPGIATITCTQNGVPLSQTYKVTIPPQSLIQMMLAEAGEQIDGEATIEQGVVTLTSRSITAECLGAVIRNRIALIDKQHTPSLFEASESAYNADPPVSSYDAIITAPNQFAPTDPNNAAHGIFDDAQDRNFLSSSWKLTYDQALLSAAAIFNGEAADPTGGAFSFRSPDADAWNLIDQALQAKADTLPTTIGVSDDNFPALAPVQILVPPHVWTYSDGRPSFIFVRSRKMGDPAITDTP